MAPIFDADEYFAVNIAVKGASHDPNTILQNSQVCTSQNAISILLDKGTRALSLMLINKLEVYSYVIYNDSTLLELFLLSNQCITEPKQHHLKFKQSIHFTRAVFSHEELYT